MLIAGPVMWKARLCLPPKCVQNSSTFSRFSPRRGTVSYLFWLPGERERVGERESEKWEAKIGRIDRWHSGIISLYQMFTECSVK